MEAHAIPRPMIGTNSRYLSVMCGKKARPTAASSRQVVWTNFVPCRLARTTRAKATQKVTTL